MARMFPQTIPDVVLRDKNRSAEIKVYGLFKEQLSDRYACYYSRPWHWFAPDGAERDGEADFVLAHPDLGILIIEVKGGRVSCRSKDGQWISIDRHDISYDIKNPVDQAKRSKYRFIELLQKSRDWRPRRFNAFHAAILPDSARPKNALGADAPLELFAFGNDLETLNVWVEQRMRDTGDGALGHDGMEALHRVLATKFELRPHLARTISDDQKHIERLTAEQSWIIESLDENPQMSVSGPAGTGKTILALERAMRSSAAGKRTLFTCYNSALAGHLRNRCGTVENLTIGSFHSVCRQLATQADVPVADVPDALLYAKVLPEALITAIGFKGELRFDSVVVDEGQDFKDDWLLALRLILVDENESEFYVFHDDNQRIYSAERSFLENLPKSKYRLNRNLRNTRAIHRTLTPWYDSRRVIPVGPEGQKVEWVESSDRQQAHAQAASIVANLIKTNQLKPSEIAILTGGRRGDCSLFAKGEIAGNNVVLAGEMGRTNGIVGDTVRRFKGLEAKCIILVDTDLLSEAELIYVGLSRASVLLYVIGRKEDLRRLSA